MTGLRDLTVVTCKVIMSQYDRERQGSITSPISPGPRRESSAAFFKGSLYVANAEKDWIDIQKNTFRNWCNEQVKDYGVEITGELSEAFEDGTLLVYLVESISTKKVGKYSKRPKLYAQKLENITAALKLLESDGIKLVNIGKCTYSARVTVDNFPYRLYYSPHHTTIQTNVK